MIHNHSQNLGYELEKKKKTLKQAL